MSDRDIEELDRLARWLDAKYRIPGTSFRFGYDSLIGLLPGVGDSVMLLPGIYLMAKARRLGVRKATLWRMAGNTALDFVIGAVPLLGDVFDATFKANLRNIALVREDLVSRSETRVSSLASPAAGHDARSERLERDAPYRGTADERET